jgi:hypothetical protein
MRWVNMDVAPSRRCARRREFGRWEWALFMERAMRGLEGMTFLISLFLRLP